MDLQLADKVFLVTGGTRGLGFATARALVEEGASVVVASRSPDSVAHAAAMLGCTGVAADLGGADSAERLVAETVRAYGRIDGALISVGGPPASEAFGLSDDQWRESFESVFLGALRLCRAVVSALPSEGGALALVLSTSVKTPIGGLAASNGLRPGLAMLAKTMADELGPRGIWVNGLMPGRVSTDRLQELDGPDPTVRQAREATIPLRRYGDPAEFGRVAAFLLSPAASYVTGAMIPVDGGALRAL